MLTSESLPFITLVLEKPKQKKPKITAAQRFEKMAKYILEKGWVQSTIDSTVWSREHWEKTPVDASDVCNRNLTAAYRIQLKLDSLPPKECPLEEACVELDEKIAQTDSVSDINQAAAEIEAVLRQYSWFVSVGVEVGVENPSLIIYANGTRYRALDEYRGGYKEFPVKIEKMAGVIPAETTT